MKNLILFITLFSTASLWAQTAAPPTSIKILGDNRSNSNLTDQEKQYSENYIDLAGGNKIINEKCVGEMKEACNGYQVDHKVMGVNSGLMRAAAQAYASFGALSDSFLPLSSGNGKTIGTDANKTANAAEAKKGEEAKKVEDAKKGDGAKQAEGNKDAPAKEKPADYCKYIPAATEMIATFNQKNTVESLSKGEEISQKEQLLKAAKSHDGRAEQAEIQSIGWIGGAACYVINAATGNFASDKNLIIKTSAAVFLGAVYQSEVSSNKEYANKTRAIANSMPSKGDCNPITENECYCSTPEYENDPTYCKDQIAKRNTGSNFTRVACTDNKLQLDPSCSCAKNNTCFDKFLEQHGSAELQLGVGYGNSPFKSIANLARGRLEGGTLGASAYAQTLAIAKRGLNELITKIPGSNNPLNPSQKELADAFASRGIPASVSRLMAQNQPPQGALNSAMAKSSGFSNNKPFEMASVSKSNVVNFSGGYGLGLGGKNMEKKNGAADLLGKMAQGKINSKILEFAQKAQAQVPQITKSDRPIFEIISIRYQTSGRRLLQIDSNN